MRIYSNLAPIVNSESEILILGSLPGPESLRNQKYYDYVGNKFWDIIYYIYDEGEVAQDYSKKEDVILKNNLALWDVLESAERITAADSDINAEKPNDFNKFLKEYPNIQGIIFNGRKAEQSFKKYFPELFKQYPNTLAWSSSGAWARKLEDKLTNWQECIDKIEKKISK